GVVLTAMRNDWRLLYWTTSAGSALVIAFEAFRHEAGQIGAPESLELQLMVATVWTGFFVLPVVARILQRGIGEAQAWYGTLVVSPASFLATWFVWRGVLADRSLAFVALGMALAHGGLALAARKDDEQLAIAQLLPAAALVGIAAVLAFDGPIVAVVLLAEAAGLVSVGRTMDVEGYEAAGHVLFLGSGLWLLRVIPELGEATVPIVNGDFLALLALPALAGWTAWSIGHDGDSTERALAGAYAVFGAFALVAGLWVELGAVSQALVTVSYATLAVALLAAGMARDSRMLSRAGLVGLAAVVVKLFIVDLASAEPIWKIGAFSGIGLVLLVVGLWISNDD
ncbi:MAG: DUF2339 domain-containing protein, partial [Acidimicrobiia bacterium]|nr:DUF2339 domain-containing protein [Acidimicrobiia bacterium]